MELKETYAVTGPQLAVLGETEQKLPPPLKKRSTASVIAVAMALVAVLCLGGLKLKGRYNAARSVYTVTDEHGYGIPTDLSARVGAAANIINLGGQMLGEQDAAVQAAQQALDAFNATASEHPADQSAANTALGSAVDALYQKLTAAGGNENAALKTQWSEFLSRQDILLREAGNGYNANAQQYNDVAGGFPANIIGGLWGCGKVELFQ